MDVLHKPTHPMCAATVVAVALAALTAAPAHASSACAALPGPDAAALMGASLPENFKRETPATKDNGHDATSVCGWFPKGYKLASASASAPPDLGVQIAVHTFRTPRDAKTFYEFSTETAPGPSAPVSDMGDAASMDEKQFSGVNVATLRLLKGSRFVQVQAWRKGGSARDAATAAARKAVSKL